MQKLDGCTGGPFKLGFGLSGAVPPQSDFNFFRHKRPVCTITDIEPPASDNGDQPAYQGRGPFAAQETALEAWHAMLY
ncbi:MAG: hypothetical protein ACLPHI_08945 [Terriglobales bacterium]